MKKHVIRKQYSRKHPTEIYVYEYNTPFFQFVSSFIQSVCLLIQIVLLGSSDKEKKDLRGRHLFNILTGGLVPRQVFISIGRQIIKVSIMVPSRITNPDLLYVLAVYNLALSPNLQWFPRWMVREIRQRARHIHFVATTFSRAEIMEMSIGAVAGMKTAYVDMFKLFPVKIISVHRVLTGKKQVAMYARYMTSTSIPNTLSLLKPYFPMLEKMPGRCKHTIKLLYEKGHNKTALSLTILLICVGKRFPRFLGSYYGGEFCGALYLFCMLPLIALDTLKRCRIVIEEAYYIVFYIENDIKTAPVTALLPEPAASLPESDALQSEPIALLPGMVSHEAADNQAVIHGSDVSSAFEKPVENCSCENCRRRIKAIPKHTRPESPEDKATVEPVHTVEQVVSDSEKNIPEPSNARHTESETKAYVGPSSKPAAKSAATSADPSGKPAAKPAAASADPSSKPAAKPAAASADPSSKPAAKPAAASADDLLRSACSAVYGGHIPPIVGTAADTIKKGKKTTAERRQINRYNTNDPSLSVQAMVEFLDTLYPGCYITDFVKAKHHGEHDVMYLHSWKKDIPCPCCGEMNPRVRDKSTLSFWDVSVRNGVGLQLKVTLGRAECLNENCSNYRKTYAEKCEFAENPQKFTKRIQYQMLVVGASSNFRDASRQMKLMGVPCVDFSISKLLKSLQFKDEVDVQVIGIDDVSCLKGRVYMTVIYSLETGHLLKLLPGRNGKGLDEFLDSHPNVHVICRDRSSAYGKLIDRYLEKHPERDLLQVPDRFHLMQNCSDNLRKAYYKSIPYTLAIDLRGKEAVLMEKLPEKKSIPVCEKPENVTEWSYDNSPALDENGKPIEFSVVIDPRSPRELQERKEECEAEYNLIRAIRQDYAEMGGRFKKGQKEAYLEKRGIVYSRFLKYIHMTDDEVEAVRDSWKRAAWKEKSFDFFKYIAYKMLKDGHGINDVYWYIKEGKNGTWDKTDTTLINYIIEVYKILHPQEMAPDPKNYITSDYEDGILVIGRQRLFYALMTLDSEKKDEKISPHLDMICKAYPVCNKVRETFKEFHDCIIADSNIEDRTPEKRQKCLENLEAFMEKHKDDVLSGFVSHLQQDKEDIKNAIMTDYHSGGVEGRNLRVKYYERMSFGKGKVETLENRLKIGFQYTDPSFSISSIAPWLVEELEDVPNGTAESAA